jgi:hypothetical protein
MLIDRTGVSLASYSPRNLYKGRRQTHIARLTGRNFLREAREAAVAAQLPGLATAAGLPDLAAKALLPDLAAAAQSDHRLAAAAAVVGTSSHPEAFGPLELDGAATGLSAVTPSPERPLDDFNLAHGEQLSRDQVLALYAHKLPNGGILCSSGQDGVNGCEGRQEDHSEELLSATA